MEEKILLWAVGALVTLAIGLLKMKDAAQAKQIDLLFDKHDEDAKKLADLELKIAQNHYVKGELDTKFDKLERAFVEGFKALGDKFDKLSTTLMRHQDDGK